MVAAMDVSGLLECPVCYEKMRPPIQTCENGHGICRICRKNVTTCGVCRKKYNKGSNTLLNQIAEKLPYLCKYSPEGCSKTLPLGELVDHEKICIYRKVNCCICTEKFLSTEMNDHFKICKGKDLETQFSNQVILNCRAPQEEIDSFFLKVYVTNIQTYFIIRRIHEYDKMFITIQYMGKDQENAGKYRYDIKINQGLPNFYITYTGLCMPYFSSLKRIKRHKGKIEADFESIFLTEDKLSSEEFELILTISELDHSNPVEKCIICETEVPLLEITDHIPRCGTSAKLETTLSKKELIDCEKTDKEEDRHKLIHITDEQTYFLWRSESNQNKTSFCVQYIGNDRENAAKYKYDIKINQGLPDSNVCYSGLCVPYTYSTEETKKRKRVTELDLESTFLTDEALKSKKYKLELLITKLSS